LAVTFPSALLTSYHLLFKAMKSVAIRAENLKRTFAEKQIIWFFAWLAGNRTIKEKN
jgi:hypothetical protein